MISDPGQISSPLRRPQSILFACSQNAVRSPMAEALARHLFEREIYFASADRKSTRLNSSHIPLSRMPSSA